MSDLYLIAKNLTRNKLRLGLNSFALLIAFLLFGTLGSLKSAFDSGVELSADERLVVVNKINFTQPLPIAYINKIASIEHVTDVTYANWFGAYFQDPRKPLVGFAADPESYLAVYPEIVLSEKERSDWLSTQQGMIVGERMANAYGWKVGDRVPISSNIFSKADGSHTWDLVISGIFKGENARTDTNLLLFHYKYFIESQTFGQDWVGWSSLNTSDARYNEQVIKAIDNLFANSAAETETTTEQQFNKAFIEQIGSIGLIVTSVVFAAFFTILLIVGNTMALAIQERTAEIAVLKTLGFPAIRIFKMVLSESLLLSFVGGLLGLGLASVVVSLAANAPDLARFLPALVLTGDIILQAISYMLLLGLLTGLIPAYRAMTLNTIDALSRS